MKIKTVDLTGPALDWAVAKCECPAIHLDHFLAMHENYRFDRGTFAYSTDWSQGGPIIERERIDIRFDRTGRSTYPWVASNLERMLGGPTPLIAAMCCFVSSRLGDEIEIPDELISGEISPNKES